MIQFSLETDRALFEDALVFAQQQVRKLIEAHPNFYPMYTVNGTTGALTSIGTIAAGLSPTSIAVHPSGRFAYVTNSASNDVSIYGIDAVTGVLTLTGTVGT